MQVVQGNGTLIGETNLFTATFLPRHIVVTPSTPLSFGNVTVNSISSEQSYTVAGYDLTDDLVITAPGDFQVSTTSGAGFGPSVTLAQSGGTVAETAIYVRFAPTAATAYSGDITHESVGVTTVNKAITGTGSLLGQPTVFRYF